MSIRFRQCGGQLGALRTHMVRKRLANVAPFSDALPLLSSRLPPLSPTTHLSHLEPTCKRPPRGAFLSLFHGLSLACCTIIITSPHSSSLLLFLLEPFLFSNFVIPISPLICSPLFFFSYLFIFSSIWETFLVWEENREVSRILRGIF